MLPLEVADSYITLHFLHLVLETLESADGKLGTTDANYNLVASSGELTLTRNSQNMYATYGYTQTCYGWDIQQKIYTFVQKWGGRVDTLTNGISSILINAWTW